MGNLGTNRRVLATGPIKIIPDTRLNALFVQANGTDLDTIKQLLEELDREERARVASAISNLAKGWVSLQDAKREILGKPKAGVRKHAVERKSRRQADWAIDPMPIPEATPAETPVG